MIKPNNIYLGDCYELIKEIPDKSVDLVYTDIPYLFDSHGVGSSDLNKRITNRTVELMSIDNRYKVSKGQTNAEALRIAKNIKNKQIGTTSLEDGIDYKIFDELCRVMKYIYIYIWCSKLQFVDILKYFVEEKKCHFNLLVWCKTNPVPATNNVWLPDLEYCFCFKERNAPRYNDGYDLKHKYYVSAANKLDKDNYSHPTIKPIELVKKHILHSTNKGDIVLDPFCGSGTTCKACQETDRKYIGFEINQKYYEIAKDRLNNINARGEVSLF